jgi:hypothetical protein
MTLINAYCTVPELLVELKRQGDATTKTNTIMELAINRASRFIDDYTGSFFYNKTVTSEAVDAYALSDTGFYLDPVRLNKISTPAPIITLTSVIEDGVTLTLNSDYFAYKKACEIVKEYRGTWSAEHNAIVLTGTFGYSSVPEEIKHACLAIASAITGMSAQILTDENGDSVAVVRNVVPSWCLDILKRNKRRVVV